MLILEKLIPEINNIVREKAGLKKERESIVKEAVDILTQIDKDKLVDLDLSKFPFFVGTPMEKPADRFLQKNDISEYIAIATDGSEIPIDPDFLFPYYLINVGTVAIRYGDKAFFNATSEPKIYYKEEDLYEEVQGRKLLVRGELLQAKMLLKESIALSSAIERYYEDSVPILSLIDGTLIQWEIQNRSEDFIRLFVNNFQQLFKKSRSLNLPIAGYVSGSHSKDVVGLVKVAALLIFKYSEKEIEKFNKIEDADIFEELLKNGERSAIFRSNVSILNYYDNPVYFFYLKLKEVVRIEIPEFVFKSEEILNLLHKLLLSQMEKGLGYPVVLREAHEQAVVTAGDKDGLEQLMLSAFAENGITFIQNLKALSKKRRGI
jgi:hypothetical protein